MSNKKAQAEAFPMQKIITYIILLIVLALILFNLGKIWDGIIFLLTSLKDKLFGKILP